MVYLKNFYFASGIAEDLYLNDIQRTCYDSSYQLKSIDDIAENSLSPEMQLELVNFLEQSVRAFRCQFIIATHSPFILSLKNALVYDLDKEPAGPNDWHKLKNVQAYYRFFMDRREEFEN